MQEANRDPGTGKTDRRRQPKGQRGPCRPALATNLVVGVPIAIGAGLTASRLIHTPTGRYVGRSLIRGLIYRAVRAF